MEITSFGTFLSTLCHEFCHHLEFQKFRFPDSWRTLALLRASCHSLSLCTGNSSEGFILGASIARAVAD